MATGKNSPAYNKVSRENTRWKFWYFSRNSQRETIGKNAAFSLVIYLWTSFVIFLAWPDQSLALSTPFDYVTSSFHLHALHYLSFFLLSFGGCVSVWGCESDKSARSWKPNELKKKGWITCEVSVPLNGPTIRRRPLGRSILSGRMLAFRFASRAFEPHGDFGCKTASHEMGNGG